MSNLLPEPLPEARAFPVFPAAPVCFEDCIESDQFDIYKLLSLSAMREKRSTGDQHEYLKSFSKLLSSRLSVLRQPCFSWQIGETQYHSTSMLFELYNSCLSLAQQIFNAAGDYKASVHLLQQCQQLLKAWKTSDLVYPTCPFVCTQEYITDMLHLTRGAMLLRLRGGPQRANALSSAMKFSGMVSFHLPHYSEVALNHYLVARALLFRHLAKEEVEQGDAANESYAAGKEALALCQLVDRTKCHVDGALDDELNGLLRELPEHLRTMEQVYYAVEVPLENLKLPASLRNDKIKAR
tara:strand:+ start:763 stop:1650 length:888 start_codon:yes stop_codon:yes gene_type:complete